MREIEIVPNIYRIMKREGVTQVELASRVHVSPQRLNDCLKGRRPMRAEELVRICNALECEPNDLFGWDTRIHQITVTDKDGTVVAHIAGELVVEHEGFHVLLT